MIYVRIINHLSFILLGSKWHNYPFLGRTLRDSPYPKNRERFYFGDRFKPKKDEYLSERFRVFKRSRIRLPGGTIHLHPFPTHWGLGTPHQEKKGPSISIWPDTFISNNIYFVNLGSQSSFSFPFLTSFSGP
ncbi:hypothetical protein CDAR_621701 [Caerostris darwini]|uniref:Uncharacterized protein n=1 Tax=Caerostris darwini TaxID=1538125 RepID=A0AAV4PAW8_9ARAC|nr:hypothetical protein CDAR_621701 [Caerostris darwini]